MKTKALLWSASRNAFCAVLTICACAFSPQQGHAAPTAESLRQQEQIVRGEEERQRQLERQHKEMLERQPQQIDITQQKTPEAPVDDSVCVQIDTITLKGAALLSESAKARLIKPYAGRCLSMRHINDLIRDITNFYVAEGYVTARAYVAPQDLSRRILEITIVEGTVEGIQLNEGTPADQRRVSAAFPGMTARPLNLRDIEQGLDQLNRLPSSNAKMEIVPGAEPGASRIVVTDQQAKTWRVRTSVDNSGQKSTGVNQYTVSLDKDNLIGFNDLLTFNWSADADTLVNFKRHQGESSSFYYSVPLGYWTVTGSASFFDYHTQLEGSGVEYRSTGNTTNYTLDVSRVLRRDADGKTTGGVSFTTKKINNFLEGERLKASSYDLSILKSSLDHNQRLLGGVFNIGVEYNLGLPVLDAPKDKTSQLTTPKHEFYKLIFSGGYTRPFDVLEHEFTFSTRAQAQWTPDTLYNSERLNLGSRYTVRGFQQDSLSGDSGGYVRNELSSSILPKDKRPEWLTKTIGDPQAYLGYDAGFIHRDETDAYERGTLQGLALGLRASSEHFGTDLCLSRPLDAPSFMKKRDWQIDWMFSFKI